MAPRVRSKKRVNLRIDAALDAMKPFGFPLKLVRDTVKELLSVYGGDDGWVFIEEGSYTLLIDTLLEKQKEGAIELVHDNERAKDHQETSIASCSSSAINEIPSNEVTMITATLPANDSDTLFPGDESYWKSDKASVDHDHLRSTFNQSLPAYTPKIRRRKPYHGWIGNDDKEEDLVYLTPDHLPEEFAKLLNAFRKRKKRWDVEPLKS
ncbi:uncharacterized protein LOC120075188 isoform X2 [Benincasa hispida]|uniref:uncharacterized protein LOC120075188 isoform X2 n=1 Tax=Benincasa hispida TaxID=102211 RepID=UPI0019009F55|nr:uncharacterized protein LOC120075188 isoform X2 [Benincasa hispida]